MSPNHFCLFSKFVMFNAQIFFPLALTWDHMGTKIAKCYSSHKSLLNFVSNILTKLFFGFFKFSDLEF